MFAEDVKKAEPLSVLIIGGGPAGLATAIEAQANGCFVTVVEKKEQLRKTSMDHPSRFFFNAIKKVGNKPSSNENSRFYR